MAFPVVDDLSLIASDDRLLDSIAAGRTEFDDLFVLPAPASSGYGDDRPDIGNVRGVAPLLALWRAQVVDPPMPALPALAVPRRVMRAPADRRRSLRPMLAAGAAICALLMGSTAVGAQSARPGDALWGLTRVLYSDHALSVEAQGKAYNLVAQAKKAFALGDTANAISLLTSAQGELEQVLPTDGQGDLKRDVDGLQGKLRARETLSTQANLAELALEAAASPGRALNAVAPTIAGVVGTVASSSSSPPSAAGSSVAALVAPPTSGSGSATSAASNPIFAPPPVPALPPTTPAASSTTPPDSPTTAPASPTSPVAPVTPPTLITSPTSTPPVDPATTASSPGPSVTDSATSVVIVTTTPPATDPGTTSSSTDPASTDTSTTSVMPTPSPSDTPSSLPDVSGLVSAQSTGTGP